jgi:carboxymethylenebutenolidase
MADGMMPLQTPEGPAAVEAAPSRRALFAGLAGALGYAAAVRPVNADAITTPGEGLIQEEVRIAGHAGYSLPAFVARPAAAGRKPVVIVASEIFGIHAYIQDTCRRLAKAGFVAIAPDYFDRAGDPSGLTDFGEILKLVSMARLPQQMGDTAGAVAWANAQPFVKRGRIGITGFCWGGTVVWSAAAQVRGIRAGVAWYGRLVKAAPQPDRPPPEDRPMPADLAGQFKAPVLGLYADADRGIPLADVETMRAALAAAKDRKSRIVVFPGTDHGFHADYRPTYNAAAATEGWTLMLAWIRQNGVR